MDVILAAKGLTKTFQSSGGEVPVLRGVNLEVRPGEFIGLVGPSGCGKSTLLNILGLADRASTGEVLLGGSPMQTASESLLRTMRRTRLGYVFQHFNLLSTLTVIENVMVPLVLNQVPVKKAKEEARSILQRVELAHRHDAMPYSLSGGEMQRVAIARAVIHKPLVILADEPTGSLDSRSGESVLELLSEQVKNGLALVMATHSEAALQRCSRVVRMQDGLIEH
jgi:putative ABC transport system ATP-binding protein